MKLNSILIVCSLLFSFVLSSCASAPEVASTSNCPEWAYDAVVYEMNIRQQSEEGTFAAAEARLPFLKELGVDII